MNYRLIDTHCHLDIIEEHGLPIGDSLKSARESGVEKIVQIGINYQNSLNAQKISRESTEMDIYYTIGCHPADDFGVAEMEHISQFIQDNAKDSKFVGVGEIGLDYYHKKDTIDFQKKAFRHFIELSIQNNLPIIIHSRDAAEDTRKILEDYKGKAFGVMHCYTYNKEYAKAFVDMGYYISFSGILAFKNAVDIHEAAKSIPLNSILVETDAPFLAPTPHRGKRNEPAYIKYTMDSLCAFRTERETDVHEKVYENSMKFIHREGM